MKSFDEWVDDMSLENEDNDIVEFTEKCFADALVRLGISENNEEKEFNSGFDIESAALFRYFQGPEKDSPKEIDGWADPRGVFEIPLRYSTGWKMKSTGLTEEALEKATTQIRSIDYDNSSDIKIPRHYYQYNQGKKDMVAVISQDVKDQIIKEYKRELLEFALINDCDEVVMKILGFNTFDDYFASAKHLTLDNMIEKWLEENE